MTCVFELVTNELSELSLVFDYNYLRQNVLRWIAPHSGDLKSGTCGS